MHNMYKQQTCASWIHSHNITHNLTTFSPSLQGDHILIDRDDKRSQLRTFKEGIGWLKQGVPLMAFPEGKRSPDGRLQDFKGGVFSMAVKCQVPIVPLSLSNTHAVMPGQSLFPVQAGQGKLHVHIHEAIDPVGKSEEELAALVKKALLSTLPLCQHPLEVDMVDGSDTTQSALEAIGSH